MKKNIFKSFKLISFLALIDLSLTTASATTSITDTPAGTEPKTKMDLMVKVADLQRQASQKQATDPKAAFNLRAQAKQLTDQANKMK